MRVSRRISIVAALLAVTVLAGLAALVGSSSSQASPQASKATFLATLVSDIGKFNDRSFNQSQIEGLMRAKKQLDVKIQPLQSNSTSDYIPNLKQAVRLHSNIIDRGRLPARRTRPTRSPRSSRDQLRDHRLLRQGRAVHHGQRPDKNVMGLDYAANQSGCLVGYLAAEMARRRGKKVIGAVGGLHIPPVDIWIAGYKFCARGSTRRTSRCSSGTPATSSSPTSARRSPRTRSPRARRCSSRSPVVAASAP